MKKILFLMLMLMFSIQLTFVAEAEEIVEDTTTETENGEGETNDVPEEFKEVTYTYNYGEHVVKVTLISETELKVIATVGGTTYSPRMPYEIVDGVLKIYLFDEASCFKINEDFTITEILPEGTIPPVEDEPSDEDEIIEEVSLTDQIKAFVEDWFMPIMSALSGLVGAISMIVIFSGKVKKLTEVIQKNKEAGDEERKKNEDELAKSQQTLEEAKVEVIASGTRLGELLSDAITELKDKNNLSNESLTNTVNSLMGNFETNITSLMGNLEARVNTSTSQMDNNVNNVLNNIITNTETLVQSLADSNETIKQLRDLLVLSISSNPSLATNEYGQKMLALLDEKEVKM